ncbi:hypothetical protein [Companilactobacillus zhachilii]|uniref:hypothetical protein n=1 Tax=Companilactobacillus zhachilii TaxID=2304606 RepID=UPI004033FF80
MALDTKEVYADDNDEVYVSHVDDEPADPEDLANAIATAPKGLDISDPTFLRGVFSNPGSTENVNSSKVIRRSNENSVDKTGILRVTHGLNQLGAIWSNIDNSNYLDISQDQSMSMWLYFGRPIDSKKPKEVGDGMAFVLQNAKPDSSPLNPFGGINAISRFNGEPAHGETLGVWGADFKNDGSAKFPENLLDLFPISGRAIPNSFAIEFDTFLNQLTLENQIDHKGVSFDAYISKSGVEKIVGQHISMDYPDGHSYDLYGSRDFDYGSTYVLAYSGNKYYYIMNHKHLQNGLNLTNSLWHHITVKFDHSTSELSYAFDDKNTDGTMKDNPVEGKQKLDMNHFKLGDGERLRWGFTGSTGAFSENNLIVFESIPSYVNADSTVSLIDTTKGNTIPGKDNNVNIGDDLDFVYDLNYKNGSREWSEILATMNLPEEVSFNGGTVTYDKKPDYREEISVSEFKDGKVKHLIQKNLSNDNKHAKIMLHTTVKQRTNKIKVAKQHAHFVSDNFIVDDDTPSFIITIPEMLLNVTSSKNINYKSMDTTPVNTQFTGTVGYSGKNIDPNIVTVYYSINNGNPKSFNLSGGSSNLANFNFDVPKTELILGNNTVKVYAKDSSGKMTSPSTINIFVGGGLRFGTVSKDVAFETVKGGYAGQLVSRKGKWQVEVEDGRTGKHGWMLKAKAEPLKKKIGDNKYTDEVFKGEIVYKNMLGEIKPLTVSTNIYTNIKDSISKQTIDVVNEWNSKLGMFLKVYDNNNSSGTYEGKITWSLIDGIGSNNT